MKLLLVLFILSSLFSGFARAQSADDAYPKDLTVRPGKFEQLGRDDIRDEFKKIARKICLQLVRNEIKLKEPVSWRIFKTKMDTALILPVDYDLIIDEGNGPELKDAINHPIENWIEINRVRWQSISTTDRKDQIVFHEILGLMKLDDRDGRISNVMLKPEKEEHIYINPRVLKAFPFSELDAYDRAAQMAGDSTSENSELIKKYYGIDRVEIAEGTREKSAQFLLRYFAQHLRDVLPADVSNDRYIKGHGYLSGKTNQSEGTDPVAKITYVMKLDSRINGVHVQSTGNQCIVSFGDQNWLEGSKMAHIMSLFINCNGDRYVPVLDNRN